jgi:OmpA-OmpF porin, OOP family
MRSRIAPFIALSLVLGATPALAQGGNPSADQIIKSLTPTGDVSRMGTRGIRLAPQGAATEAPMAAEAPKPVAHHAAVAAARPAPAPAAQPEGVAAVNLTVNFASGSAELTPQAIQTLDALGTALSSEALSHYRFRVEGHTDTVGSPQANRALSAQRAAAVVSYIASKFNIDPSRLEAVGLGSDKPLIATAAQVAEPRNRRVQIVNLGS